MPSRAARETPGGRKRERRGLRAVSTLGGGVERRGGVQWRVRPTIFGLSVGGGTFIYLHFMRFASISCDFPRSASMLPPCYIRVTSYVPPFQVPGRLDALPADRDQPYQANHRLHLHRFLALVLALR